MKTYPFIERLQLFSTFKKIQKPRQNLTHFKHSYDTKDIGLNTTITGVSNVSFYHKLDIETGVKARNLVIEFVREIGSMTITNEIEIERFIHYWLGHMTDKLLDLYG